MVSSEDSAWDVPPSIFGTRAGGPTVQRLVLGSQLHRLRESRGITAEQAAEAIRGSHSKISRMEHGRVGFKERDVGDLLTLYGVTDSEERRALIRQGAAESEEEIARRSELRASRQEILRRPDAPQLWVVVDEGALRRPVGSREIVREQLQYLTEIVDHPAVTLQILSFSAGAHSAMGGPFSILRFAEPDLQDVVYIEQLTSALYLDKPVEVDSYLEVMEQLCLQAEPVANTTKVLQQILADI